MGSLSLRPAALPTGNLRPLITQTPLPSATGAYGQLPGRDFNPLDKQLLLRTDIIRISGKWGSRITSSGNLSEGTYTAP